MNAFKVDDIGPCTVQSRGLAGAVEVDEEFVARSRFGGFVIEIGYGLVVVVHEIDLETLDAHVGIVLAHVLHVAHESVVPGPQDKPDALLVGVGHKLRQVYLRDNLHEVGFFVYGPSFVENHILDAVVAGKVYVGFICIVVYAAYEIDTVEIPVVPPVPCHFAGLDPRGVIES